MNDLIKREDAIKALRCEYPTMPIFKGLREEWAIKTEGFRKAEEVIMNLPSADRPQGEWVPFEYGDEKWHKCTACGVADKYIEYVERPNGTTGKLVAIRNYCPNCGARMFAKDTNVPNKEGADDGDQ